MFLRHCRFRAVADIVADASEIGQASTGSIDILAAVTIHENEAVGAFGVADVNIFTQLDVALGAENGQTTVTPGRQRIRCIPVDADIAVALVAAQHDLAEILKARIVRVGVIGNGGGHDLNLGRTREEHELVDLVAGNVGDDTTVGFALEEPLRANLAVQAVRAKADSLDDAADGALRNEFSSLGHAWDFEALGEIHGPDALGLCHRLAQAVELFECGATGLVGHDILAGFHGGNREIGALGGNIGDHDEIDGAVSQQRLFRCCARHIREALDEAFHDIGLAFRPPAGKFGASIQQVLGHAENVPVLNPESDELDCFTHPAVPLPCRCRPS